MLTYYLGRSINRWRHLIRDPERNGGVIGDEDGDLYTRANALDFINEAYFRYYSLRSKTIESSSILTDQLVDQVLLSYFDWIWDAAQDPQLPGALVFDQIESTFGGGQFNPLEIRPADEIAYLQETEGLHNGYNYAPGNTLSVGYRISRWQSGDDYPMLRFYLYPFVNAPRGTGRLKLWYHGETPPYGRITNETDQFQLRRHEVEHVIRMAAADAMVAAKRPWHMIEAILKEVPNDLVAHLNTTVYRAELTEPKATERLLR